MSSSPALRNPKFASSTVYQVYVKSFNDTTGDGVGDLNGITERLDYLADLGVDYVWITPFYESPQRDNGYDVGNYRTIKTCYGTMADFERLVSEASRRGLKIMLDMVLNHTSTSHEWFQQALAGDARYQDFYFFRDPDPKDPKRPPTNWASKFGGPAWAFEPRLNKWYLHLFDRTQADLNWDNPEVRQEVADIVRFWRDKGVEGFRLDVVNLISKPDIFVDDELGDGRRFYTDGPRVHEYLQGLVRDAGIDGLMTVGEMSSTSLEACLGYTRPSDHELVSVFNFHHLKVDYKNGDKWSLMDPDLNELVRLFQTWQEGMQAGGGWNALFWDNHDQPRAVSRFCDDGVLRVPSAKMLAMVGLLMRGTPYIYQGDELGVTNGHFDSIEEYCDVESLNYYQILLAQGMEPAEALRTIGERSRDNGRLPMQWNGEPGRGFTTGTPWEHFAKDAPGCDQAEISAEAEARDKDSILAFYRQLTQVRHDIPVVATGKIRFLDVDAVPVIAFARYGELPMGEPYDVSCDDTQDLLEEGSLLVMGNFSAEPASVGADVQALIAAGGWEVFLASHRDRLEADAGDAKGSAVPGIESGLVLRPFEGLVLRRV